MRKVLESYCFALNGRRMLGVCIGYVSQELVAFFCTVFVEFKQLIKRYIMNFVSVKKNFLALFVFFLMGTGVMGASDKVQFQDDECEYIHNLAREIEEMFEFFNDNVARFIDSGDHTPYRKLVMGMSDKLDEFEKHVMITLAKKLVEAKTKNAEAFRQCLSIVQEVLEEFLTKLDVLRKILVKPEYLNARDGIQAIKLGKELEKYCKDLLDGKIMAQLEIKIDNVYALVSSAGDSSLTERLKEIKASLKTLKGASLQKKSGSELKIVNGITAKIRHNKP